MSTQAFRGFQPQSSSHHQFSASSGGPRHWETDTNHPCTAQVKSLTHQLCEYNTWSFYPLCFGIGCYTVVGNPSPPLFIPLAPPTASRTRCEILEGPQPSGSNLFVSIYRPLEEASAPAKLVYSVSPTFSLLVFSTPLTSL